MNVKVKLADVDAVPGLMKSGEQFFMVVLDRPRTLTEEWLECGRAVAEWADREREKRRSKAVSSVFHAGPKTVPEKQGGK